MSAVKGSKDWLLHKAILEGSVDDIRKLLAEGTDLNLGVGFGLLMVCLEENRVEVAEVLVEAGADVNARGTDGTTLLHSSIQRANQDFFNLIINSGGKVNAANDEGITPLHLAAGSLGREGFIRPLLEKGGMVDAACVRGETPLHLAGTSGFLANVLLLLEYRPDLSSRHYQDLVCSVWRAYTGSRIQITNVLVDYGFKVNVDRDISSELLYEATAEGCEGLVKHFILGGCVDVDEFHKQDLLNLAFKNGHLAIVEFFRTIGFGIDLKRKYDALLNAVSRNNRDMLKAMMPLYGDLETTKRMKLLLTAVEHKAPDSLQCLLELERPHVNVNSSLRGRRLIHYSHRNTLEVLWEHGADVDIEDSQGNTPLHEACTAQRADVVSGLLRLGASVNRLNKEGKAPFQLTANAAVLETLAKHVAALHAAGLHVSHKCLSFIQTYSQSYKVECRKEIESLKASKISNGKYSFFHLLTYPENKMATLVKNPEIEVAMESVGTYPIYGDLIKTKLKAGIKRRALLDECLNLTIPTISAFEHVPWDVREHILSHLTTEQLGVLSGRHHLQVEVMPD